MTPVDARLRQVRMLALLICALSLLVVAVSAWLRLDAAGVGCAPWPECYARLLTADPSPLHYGFARLLHRAVASSALLLTLLLVWRCLRPQPLQPAARYAVLLLLLMLALSALGFASADPRRALVGALNIVGGLGLVTFSWRVAMAAGACAPVSTPVTDPFLRIGVGVLTLAVLMGAWLGATYSAPACPSLPFCEMKAWNLAEGLRALDPFQRLQAAAMPGDAGGTTLHLLHRGSAILSLLLLGGVAARTRRPVARVVAGLLVGVMLLGMVVVAAVGSGFERWLIVGHGAAAALLLAAVATLLRR